MKIPPAIWWIAIPTLIGAITPVIATFYPVNVYFWSALVVAIGGAIVSAIAAYRQIADQQPPTPPQNTPAPPRTRSMSDAPGIAEAAYTSQPRTGPGFMRTWLIG